MRTKEQLQENNYQLLKQSILNIIDFQQNERASYLKEENKKSYLREFATLKFCTSRQSGHTTGILRCLWDLPYKNILFLSHRRQNIKHAKDIFEHLIIGQIRHPEHGMIHVEKHLDSYIRNTCDVIYHPDIPFKTTFRIWDSVLNSYKPDLIIVDLYSFLPKTKEDELYDFASVSGTELIIFLQ